MIPEVRRIVEMASGLNYMDGADGLWKASQDLIELMPDGTAAALRAPCKVRFQSDLWLIITTDQGTVYRTRPVGLYYFDPRTT